MTNFLTHLVALTVLAAPPAEPKQDALQSIESNRGGRHWIDAKTDPPKSPAGTLKTLKTEPGLEIQLVAAEPLVIDPVAIAFDREGRLFVVEYGDYPIGPPAGEKPLSRVVYLEDENGDGKADRRHVFADHLNFAHSLMAYKGGWLVGAQSQILFLKDTTGDEKADVRQVLFDGFKAAHPQMQIGNPRWGLDNWVYFNYGPGKITSSAAPDKPVDMPRLDFRFHPLTMEFGPDAGLGQFGNTVDNWGNRFYCTNRNPIMATMLPYATTRRNPFVIIPKAYYDVGTSGGESRVYPLVEMKSNYLSHAGTHTSACGTTAYRGDLLGGDFPSSVFVCEPIGHLVTRSIVKPDGVALTADRARPKADFIASTDTWFRPASLATGPDGGLYLADMYRLWVEHPKFLPPEIAERIDWRAGDDRGRVYRIVPKGAPRRGYTPPKTVPDYVKLLDEESGWKRTLGQRLLVESQSVEAASAVRKLLTDGRRPLTRLHALWTLEGLGKLTWSDVSRALDDGDSHVRKNAAKLAMQFGKDRPNLLKRLAKSAKDENVNVRFEVALALGETDDVQATELLAELARRDGTDRWFALAILSSTEKRSADVLARLLQDSKFTAHGDAARVSLVRQLATVVGARGDAGELATLLNTITSAKETGAWWQTAQLSGLALGLPRHRGALGRMSLAKLLATPPAALDESVAGVRDVMKEIGNVALDRKRDVDSRVAAIELLGYQPYDQAAPQLGQLLASTQPADVQLACINALRNTGGDKAAGILLERWPELSPGVRGPALTLLSRRTTTTLLMLEAMAAGRVNASAIGVDQRVRLLKHGDAKIRALAVKLFGGAISSNRRSVAQQYAPALKQKASIDAGAAVFNRTCAQCHKIEGHGHELGPDISDVRNRSVEALLYDILDPNLKVEPRFIDYAVATEDGRVFNGLMVTETDEAVVLGQAEGKQQVIARSEIGAIRASGKSLMPEGVEKDITVQQMADLLAFLKSAEKGKVLERVPAEQE